jgi:hypothetical protein
MDQSCRAASRMSREMSSQLADIVPIRREGMAPASSLAAPGVVRTRLTPRGSTPSARQRQGRHATALQAGCASVYCLGNRTALYSPPPSRADRGRSVMPIARKHLRSPLMGEDSGGW